MKKKILGAVLSGLLFEIIFISFTIAMIYFQITDENKMPLPMFIIVISIEIVLIISLLYSTISRIKEIKGGEEDEASKY